MSCTRCGYFGDACKCSESDVNPIKKILDDNRITEKELEVYTVSMVREITEKVRQQAIEDTKAACIEAVKKLLRNISTRYAIDGSCSQYIKVSNVITSIEEVGVE